MGMRGFDVLVVCGPLDLGDVEGKILSEIKREIRLYAGGGDEWMDLYEEFEGLNNTFRILEIAVNVFKQRLESACEFYLRYKDNPELLRKEWDEYFYEKIVSYYGGIDVSEVTVEIFNDWLFRLAFKDVLGDDEK